jgi:hypothetical protein
LDEDAFAQLFEAFYKYALAEPGDLISKANSLMFGVYQTFESGHGGQQILNLCIAIESLLRAGGALLPEHRFEQEEHDRINVALDQCGLSPPKRARLTALLAQLNSASTSYLFDQVIKAEILAKEHKTTWNKHRSVLAHGGDVKGETPQLLKDRAILLNGFHRLVQRELREPRLR